MPGFLLAKICRPLLCCEHQIIATVAWMAFSLSIPPLPPGRLRYVTGLGLLFSIRVMPPVICSLGSSMHLAFREGPSGLYLIAPEGGNKEPGFAVRELVFCQLVSIGDFCQFMLEVERGYDPTQGIIQFRTALQDMACLKGLEVSLCL